MTPAPKFRVSWQGDYDRVYNCDFNQAEAALQFAETIEGHDSVRNVLVDKITWVADFERIYEGDPS